MLSDNKILINENKTLSELTIQLKVYKDELMDINDKISKIPIINSNIKQSDSKLIIDIVIKTYNDIYNKYLNASSELEEFKNDFKTKQLNYEQLIKRNNELEQTLKAFDLNVYFKRPLSSRRNNRSQSPLITKKNLNASFNKSSEKTVKFSDGIS